MLGAVIDGQPQVPLMKAAAPSLMMNSESAASWPKRIETLSLSSLCSNQSSKSRVAGRRLDEAHRHEGAAVFCPVMLSPWIW